MEREDSSPRCPLGVTAHNDEEGGSASLGQQQQLTVFECSTIDSTKLPPTKLLHVPHHPHVSLTGVSKRPQVSGRVGGTVVSSCCTAASVPTLRVNGICGKAMEVQAWVNGGSLKRQ